MSSFGSSSSISEFTYEYDVFLTSCHPKHHVAAYLEKNLRDAEISTLIDDHLDEFPMNECRMVVVVFTPQFAESNTFLQRLMNIRQCQKHMNKRVLPVFCGLSQQQVCEQLEAVDQGRLNGSIWDLDSGGFVAEAALLLDSATVVAEAASLSDLWHKISSCVANLGPCMLHDQLFHDLPCHQVGLPLRVRELLQTLRWRYILSDDTIIVKIWGDGGVGKTMIVKAIYDRIGDNFEHKSFLLNIGNEWGKNLQKQLISDISETKLDEIDVFSLDQQMKQVLSGRRVLLVLDNAYRGFKLEKLLVNVKYCGKGSLIFITTRNKATCEFSTDISYEMKRLNNKESLELFCWHAFKKFAPTNDFCDFSEQFIEYCEGLPLALEVFGSLLHNRTEKEWEKILNDMARICRSQIQKKLKISYDWLTDTEKDLFFNIACFYVGQSKHYVRQCLKSSRLPVEMGMSALIERNLVKVMNKRLYVHDLLQDIGRQISPGKPKLKFIYDVFLSFRGEDTRESFTFELCVALKQVGIEVYMDEDRLEKGENISSSLLEAIQCSRISIIILSKNYGGSSWCLQELEKIMECYKTSYQVVFPIFFYVTPSEVRKQQNDFGKAWERLYKRTSSTKMKKLIINSKRVLIKVANLSGWDMHNYRTETELIDEVIETVKEKLGEKKKLDDKMFLFVASYPVGLESRMQDILQLLRSQSKDVIITGIWGMGGIGKTTIAKAIYNEVSQSFEGECFLPNIREVWMQDNGLVHLQEQLLSEILKSRRIALPNVEMGKTLLKERLRKKRVFLVLDDVNNEYQLKALCGSREWFGQGSRIIITTRDEYLLKILRVNHVYATKELNDNESLELFSWHAFKQSIPEQDFIDLSRRMVSYSGGLPLALEVLGSYLFNRDRFTWESALWKLHQIPNEQINQKLKISFHGLSNHTEKEIFLDICCFFIGKDKSYTTQILNACGLHADIGINRLIERSLVRVNDKNKLEMNDLLRDMGREIIREQSYKELGKRSRLWFHNDVLDVLRKETGTEFIEGLALKLPTWNSSFLSAKSFKKMKRLRLLQLDNVHIIGDYSYLSNDLRWLCWHRFPLKSLPINFNLENVVAIDLKWSNLVKVWGKNQLLEGLKSLNLSHSHYLIETPDFSKIPHLEKLILKDCSSLSVIHSSIGDLKEIVMLNLKDCKSLNSLPRSLYHLKSLKTLILSGCLKIEKLEEDIEQMESLTTLMANQTAITQVPFSLLRLKSIKYVSLCGYEGLSSDVFPSLVFSCTPSTYHSNSLLQEFRTMPSLIGGLSEAEASTSEASCQNTSTLVEFHEQIHMESSEALMKSLTIQVGRSNKIMDTLLKSISKGWKDRGFHYSLPKENYPDWLVFNHDGSSVSFKVPQVFGHCLKGMVLNIIYSSLQDNMTSVNSIGIIINNFTRETMDLYKREVARTAADEEWQNIVSNLEPGNEVEVEIKFAYKHIVMEKTTIYLVYVEENETTK